MQSGFTMPPAEPPITSLMQMTDTHVLLTLRLRPRSALVEEDTDSDDLPDLVSSSDADEDVEKEWFLRHLLYIIFKVEGVS